MPLHVQIAKRKETDRERKTDQQFDRFRRGAGGYVAPRFTSWSSEPSHWSDWKSADNPRKNFVLEPKPLDQ